MRTSTALGALLSFAAELCASHSGMAHGSKAARLLFLPKLSICCCTTLLLVGATRSPSHRKSGVKRLFLPQNVKQPGDKTQRPVTWKEGFKQPGRGP